MPSSNEILSSSQVAAEEIHDDKSTEINPASTSESIDAKGSSLTEKCNEQILNFNDSPLCSNPDDTLSGLPSSSCVTLPGDDCLNIDKNSSLTFEESKLHVDFNVCEVEVKSDVADSCSEKILNNDEELESLDSNVISFSSKLTVEKYQYYPAAIHFYTGLENFEKFMFVYTTLGNAVDHLRYYYCKKPDNISALNFFF